MADTVSLEDLRAWARQLSDTENDPNVTDDELTDLANRHVPEVFDRLVDAGPPEYYAADVTVTTSAGAHQYALPANFRSLMDVYVHETSDERRPLTEMPPGTRGRFKVPQATYTLTVEYIPTASRLVEDTDTFDGVSGWWELIAKLMARDVMIKREAYQGQLDAQIAMLQGRIVSRGRGRNKGAPKRIVDLDEVHASPSPYGWTRTSNIACDRLRGDNIELYELMVGAP